MLLSVSDVLADMSIFCDFLINSLHKLYKKYKEPTKNPDKIESYLQVTSFLPVGSSTLYILNVWISTPSILIVLITNRRIA